MFCAPIGEAAHTVNDLIRAYEQQIHGTATP
jgi:hypothetical protein